MRVCFMGARAGARAVGTRVSLNLSLLYVQSCVQLRTVVQLRSVTCRFTVAYIRVQLRVEAVKVKQPLYVYVTLRCA